MYYTAGLLFFAVSALGGAVQPKSSCVDLDSVIENKLLSPIREKISSSSSKYVSIPNWGSEIFGWGIYANGGVIGDAHSFHLAHQDGNRPSAEICTDANTQTLRIDLEFDKLEAVYNTFAIHIPYLLDSHQTQATFGLTANRMSAQFTLTANDKNDDHKCVISLNDLKVLGNPSIYSDGGIINFCFDQIFNLLSPYFANTVMNWLNDFNIPREIASLTAVPAITTNRQFICDLIQKIKLSSL